MSKVCDGLCGDAFVAAQQVGLDNLFDNYRWKIKRVDTLISHRRGMVFPLTEHESKELISPVLPYATPTLLDIVDPVVHFSEGHRSDMLLGESGLTREERVMVQASV